MRVRHPYPHGSQVSGSQHTSGTQVKIQFERTIEKNTGGERAERRKGVSISMNVVSQNLGETRFGLSVQWYAAYCTEIRERKRENIKRG